MSAGYAESEELIPRAPLVLQESSHGSCASRRSKTMVDKKWTFALTLEKFFKFLYHDGAICNKRPLEWLFVILYLISLWTLIGLLSYSGLVFLQYSLKGGPRYYGSTTFIGGKPGITFEPRDRLSREKKYIIKWKQGDYSSYEKHVIRLKEIMTEYVNKGMSGQDCNTKQIMRNGGKPTNESCYLNVSDTDEKHGFGECALPTGLKSRLPTFGFDKDSPCVMLRINKIFGYYPEQMKKDFMKKYEDLNGNTTTAYTTKSYQYRNICESVKLCCNDERMMFRCELSNNNGGVSLRYFPEYGFPYCYFPYNNQKNYQQPFIMVQIVNMKRNSSLDVNCSPSASDISDRTLTFTLSMH